MNRAYAQRLPDRPAAAGPSFARMRRFASPAVKAVMVRRWREFLGVVAGLSGVTQLATGQRHVLALMADGSVKAWGDNDELAIGNGRDERLFTSPQNVTGLPAIRRVAAGGRAAGHPARPGPRPG